MADVFRQWKQVCRIDKVINTTPPFWLNQHTMRTSKAERPDGSSYRFTVN